MYRIEHSMFIVFIVVAVFCLDCLIAFQFVYGAT